MANTSTGMSRTMMLALSTVQWDIFHVPTRRSPEGGPSSASRSQAMTLGGGRVGTGSVPMLGAPVLAAFNSSPKDRLARLGSTAAGGDDITTSESAVLATTSLEGSGDNSPAVLVRPAGPGPSAE